MKLGPRHDAALRHDVALSWVVVGLTFLLVLGVNAVSFRRYVRWDWTEQHIYTLSQRSLGLLHRLGQRVDIYMFLSSQEPQYAEVRDLLEAYRATSRHIALRIVDPDLEPAEFRVLAQRFGLIAAELESGETLADVALVIASAAGKHWSITRNDLIGVGDEHMDEENPVELQVTAEQAITGGLVQVLEGRSTRVCVTQGHGEWGVSDERERSLQPLAVELKRENVEFITLDTLSQRHVPSDCDAVFVVGPLAPFNKFEADVLQTYFDQGGRVLLALDPVIEFDAVIPTGLEAFCGRYGIRINRDVVMELSDSRLLSGSPLEGFIATDYAEHPLMRGLSEMGARIALRLARSVEPTAVGNARVLLQTSPESYRERRVERLVVHAPAPAPGTPRGAASLAVSVELQPEAVETGNGANRQARLAVIGDSDWLSAGFVQSPELNNFDLASVLTGWLSHRDALIEIPPKRVRTTAAMMSEADLARVRLATLIIVPLITLLLGFAVWWVRRA